MKPFNQFNISDFSRDKETLIATFHYNFDNQAFFEEKIDFSAAKEKEYFLVKNNNIEEIVSLLTHLHIALGISYYKLYPTKEINVNTIGLSEEQKNFWNTFYLKGLWEFFYRNKINPTGLAQFNSTKNYQKNTPLTINAKKYLTLFWWWKDSLVTIELLKEKNEEFDIFTFWKDYPLHQIAEIPTWKKRLIIKRFLDLEKLSLYTQQWYYNWHVPITGIISFVSCIIGYLYCYKGVIASLEKSADVGNTYYYDMDINHQRSKSKEFEDLFNNYINKYVLKDFSFQSLIRDWYEIKVVKEFSKYSQYFKSFSSCNRNFNIIESKLSHDKLRCWECPKCAFVYTMLRAFIWKEKTNEIFWKDLFEDNTLIPLFEELLGIEGIKPFECVGTNEEMVLGFRLIDQQEKNNNSNIMKIFKERIWTSMSTDDFLKLQTKLWI